MATKTKFFCKNKKCRVFLFETDGVFLYVENLQILPKVKTLKKPSPNTDTEKNKHGKNIICPECGKDNKIILQKAPASEPAKEKKFSIFRSRF